MLKKICNQISQWQSENIPNTPIAINISAKQLSQSSFYPFIHDMLINNKLNGNWINLEITESSLIESFQYVIKNMNALVKLGITFSLDDFGTGYSSLSYLLQLPLQYLKIDKSFVNDVPINQNACKLIKAIIAMAQSTNLTTIAEGVENYDQYQFLKSQHCNQIQGFLFSPAVSAHDFKNMLVKNKQFKLP